MTPVAAAAGVIFGRGSGAAVAAFCGMDRFFLDNSDGDGMIRIEDGHGSGMGDGPLSRELRAGINERGLGQEMKGEAVSIV